MQEIEIIGKAVKKYESGYPMVSRDDFVKPGDFAEGAWVQLMNHKHFVATAYLADVKKGTGWVLSRSSNQTIDADFIVKLFKSASIRRQTFYLADPQNATYRVFNADGDGIGGLTIDVYAGHYVISYDNPGLYYQRKLINQAFNVVFRDTLSVTEIRRYNKEVQVLSGTLPEQPFMVNEAGINFPLDLSEVNAGLDLEYRGVRQFVRTHAEGKTMLSIFGATAGMTISAAMGGAVKTVSVDPTNKTARDQEALLAANQFELANHEVRTMDVDGYLDYAIKHELTFDLVTLTPPAFIHGKKRNFVLAKDFGDLIELALHAMAQGGDLVVTTTAPNYSLKKLRTVVNEVVAEFDGHVTVNESFKSPEDFVTNDDFRQSEVMKGLVLHLH